MITNVDSKQANGKFKFILIDNKLYIQRLSTPCLVLLQIHSCYSLGSDQVLQ
jgi:hypothetical protein